MYIIIKYIKYLSINKLVFVYVYNLFISVKIIMSGLVWLYIQFVYMQILRL